MCLDDTVRIPLRARDGSVRAYALIDAADTDFVNQWRWCLSRNGYAQRENHWMHRDLLGLTPGDGLEGDHINRNRLDNRRSNLRKVTKRGNRQNVSSNRRSTSIYRGVSWSSKQKKWVSQIKVNKQNIVLGMFDNEEHAAEVARRARHQNMPFSHD